LGLVVRDCVGLVEVSASVYIELEEGIKLTGAAFLAAGFRALAVLALVFGVAVAFDAGAVFLGAALAGVVLVVAAAAGFL